ncbi:MAG TPA: winged helix-turn-helix domain-containing protein [Vicinamibacterales bacterium]|nr:winged helix-turn-helix domain-containing protein [Vicinamibacterales bacterium]
MRDTNEPGLSFHPAARRIVHFGPFRADLSDGSLWRGADEVRLPPRALALLLYLVERPGRVVPKDVLMDAVWKDAHVSETSLTEAMGIVRQTLGDSSQRPEYIQTVHRRGYRFIARVSTAPPETAAFVAREVEPPAVSDPESPLTPAVSPTVRPSRGGRFWIAATSLALVMVTAIAIWTLSVRSTATPEVTRATITLPAGQAPAPGLNAHTVVALSPDGQSMVYVAGTTGEYQLFTRLMDQFEARPIPGTSGAHGPFFSPDGQRIGFFSEGRLRHVATIGSEALSLAEAPGGLGAWWTDRRTIIFARDFTGGLWEVDQSGGTPREIVPAPEPTVGYRWPQLLPDGRTIVATRWAPDRRHSVVALSADSGGEVVLATEAIYGRYLPNGYLLFVRHNALMAAAYRPGGTPGDARPVLAHVMTGSTGAAQLSLSSTGSLIYIPDDPGRAERSLVRVDVSGRRAAASHERRRFENLSICRERLAVTITESGASDLWTGTVAGGPLTRLTNDGAVIEPVWRPGCEEIAYSAHGQMYLLGTHGAESARRLQDSSNVQAPLSWSPDGQQLVYVEVAPKTGGDVWVLNLADGRRSPLVATPAAEGGARLSPDGRWLAYGSSDTGRAQVYLRPFQTDGPRIQISKAGGVAAAWSDDGRWLHYRRGNSIVSVAVDPSAGPDISAPARTLDLPDLVIFKPLPRSQDFMVLQRIREHLPLTTLNLVINWRAEVEERLRR